MTNWIKRWQNNEIGWHKDYFNPRLIKFLTKLQLKQADTIFVPLCGKSLDIIYLLNCGFKVIGVEISSVAIIAFFSENNISYTTYKDNNIMVYKAENITIFCTSFFKINKSYLSAINAIYDRASLIALDKTLRADYVKHLSGIIPPKTKLLLLTLNYMQNKMSGPPFAVSFAEVKQIFNNFDIIQLSSFNDVENEVRFKNAGLEFIDKDSYLLEFNG